MQMSEPGVRLLYEAARELGLELGPVLPSFQLLYRRLLEANRATNLTAIRDEKGIILKHFVDSLSCLKGDGLEGSLRAIDVGTGAGFPGLPIKIVRPALHLTFLDATQKKIAFVEAVCQELGLAPVRCIWGRAEELGQHPDHREAYDRVLSRAVGSLSVLSELCLPLLKPGGVMIAQKGPGVEAELEHAQAAIGLLGGRVREVITFELPALREHRSLVIIEKVGPTPSKYPRRPGLVQKNPLS
ncbi:16S rRNA (guanine(527)-N(7))-methyltransferase RsmG [Meiothermus rufus]|uniref:16S rRNA (guanine(527)-N(7))-methyltransferase RsmG n=1 Tax=Meiothermus rufus TaxID=604332 RepID=UPI000481DA6D|nr:16S rRNA (guanine(527)-N(7))-methyltransferase RsmG [Meiothermus rufus]